MERTVLRSWRLVVTVVMTLGLIIPPHSAEAADFYSGKTINLYIGQGPGGGYDQYGRLVARYLGHFVPGNPQVVPQNMPGAGGLKVVGYLSQVAPQDGTALAVSAEAVALEQALQGPGVDYDATRLFWIGRMATSASIFFTWQGSKVKTIEDARLYESAFGSTGITGITGYTPRALNNLAGTKFKIVVGYTGSADVLLAMERNEIDGGFALWPEFKEQKPALLKDQRVNILYIVSAQRASDLPNVPTTEELGQNEEARAILRFLASTSEVGRAVFSTPNVPAERVEQLRRAFDTMTMDARFLADAQKIGLRIAPATGKALQKLVTDVIGFPQPLVERAKQARK
jgi:tripartite-type tricarboxylate transporter receptor subunit TctC